MRKSLSVIVAAGLLLYPFATFAADYGSQTSQTQQVPPVAQTLVREGDFAIKLAAELDLGLPTDEAVAEDILARAGVVPLNGWISDYPVTPEILGQLQDSIAKAASEGKLPMTAEQAAGGLFSLADQMGLPTPAGSPIAPAADTQAPAEQSNPPINPTVINNYYDQGPPVITYYPPPVYYGYLYDWVPYPVWWFGFWFPGFYICHDFTTVIVIKSGDRDGHGKHGKRGIVSNHVIDPVTKTAAVVSPVVKTGTGTVKPVTTLRSGSGRTFRTFADLRKETGVTGLQAGKPETSVHAALRRRADGFKSPEARKNAEAIYNGSVERERGGGRRFIAPGAPERQYRPPAVKGSNEHVRPFFAAPRPFSSGERRFTAPQRSFRPPVVMRERNEFFRPLAAPGAPARSFNVPVARGGRHPLRMFSGNGWGGR